MADVVVEQVVQRPRISWGAIFAGAISALSLWILLYAFGLAVGLSSLNPSNPGSVRGAGIFTGVWSLIAPLIALFIGGYVAGRGASTATRGTGASHGLVVWGLTTLIGTSMFAMVASALVGGVVSVGRAAASAGGNALGAAAKASGGAARAVGIDADDVLAPVNDRLRAEGKPTISAEQLEAATRDVAQTVVRQGGLDRDALAASIARNTALSRPDAEEIADRIDARVQQASGEMSDRLHAAAQRAETGALKVGDATGKVFWGVFGALLLGLIAALVGGAIGAPGFSHGPRRRERRVVSGPAAIATPREVHP